MKMTFSGFRGFGERGELLDIKDITLLTGKNSSGKSTFIKLIQLLSEALKGIDNLNDFANIEINIANDIIGGKENLESLKKVIQPKWIFSIPFEFFNAYHEVHVNFNIDNYILSVDTLEIYDEFCLETETPLFVLKKDIVTVNSRYILKHYNKYALLYNLNETLHRIINENEENYVDEITKMISDFSTQNNYPKGTIFEHFKTHIPYNNQVGYLFQVSNEEFNHPFKGQETYSSIFIYNKLNISNVDNLDINKEEAIEIVMNSEHYEEVNAYISERLIYEPDFDFFGQLVDLYNAELANIILGNEEFNYDDGLASVKRSMDSEFYSFDLEKNSLTQYGDMERQISFPDWENFYPAIFYDKFVIALKVATISSHIFQHFILRFFRRLVEMKFQSNIRTIPERSFNIYNASNIFSSFIKNWKILNDEDRLIKMEFLKKYLLKFEIADDLEIKFEGNIGFLRLIKKGHSFSIIDEGSGISNLLSCLLFISQFLKVNDSAFDAKDERQYLVLEEPEANLHPCLQSLLADFFVDVISNYKVSLIIETHSEYLIRKLQYLIAKQKMHPSEISLNYFTMTYDNNVPEILNRRINLLENGNLDKEFGPGFYDEADNIAMDLFKLQMSQNN